MNRAVFLDRDGTVIEERHYLGDPIEVRLLPGAGAALRRLQDDGFLLVLVTNQSGVGRGYFSLADVDRVHARLADLLAAHHVRFHHIYVAPEAPDQPSRGRKPSPQFLFEAREDFKLSLSHSYMVGDKLIDLECGWNAGVSRSLLVRTGYGTELEQSDPAVRERATIVDDLRAAADWILANNHGPITQLPAGASSS